MVLAEYKNILPEPKETVNVLKKYQFIETNKGYVREFTELRPIGYRWAIRHTISDKWTVTNEEDLEVFVRNYIRL